MFIVLFYLIIIITLGFVLFNNLHTFSGVKNNIVYSKYGKLLFEGDLLKMSIGPISIILCKLFLINFIYFANASILLLLVLIVITSNRFINFLFNCHQTIISCIIVFNEFFNDVVNSVNYNNLSFNLNRFYINKNKKSSMRAGGLLYNSCWKSYKALLLQLEYRCVEWEPCYIPMLYRFQSQKHLTLMKHNK